MLVDLSLHVPTKAPDLFRQPCWGEHCATGSNPSILQMGTKTLVHICCTCKALSFHYFTDLNKKRQNIWTENENNEYIKGDFLHLHLYKWANSVSTLSHSNSLTFPHLSVTHIHKPSWILSPVSYGAYVTSLSLSNHLYNDTSEETQNPGLLCLPCSIHALACWMRDISLDYNPLLSQVHSTWNSVSYRHKSCYVPANDLTMTCLVQSFMLSVEAKGDGRSRNKM